MSIHRLLFAERIGEQSPIDPTEYFRWCFDLDFGGSSPSGSTTTTVATKPQPVVEGALNRVLPQAEQLLNIPVQQPDFDTVVPFSNQTENALQLQEARALGGSPLEQAAQNTILETARGDFLDRQNPAFNDFAQRITGDIGSVINSNFAQSGRLGSQANAQALGRGIGDVLAPLAFQDFQTERANQLAASELAPGLAQIDFQNIGQLGQVGATREAQQGAQLQDQIARFNFAQQEPRSRIAEVLALIAGGNIGGTQSTTQPIFSNPLATGLGTAASLAGIGASLFGRNNGIFR